MYNFISETASICQEILIPIFSTLLLIILIFYFVYKKNYYIKRINIIDSIDKFIQILYEEYKREISNNKITKFKHKEENK